MEEKGETKHAAEKKPDDGGEKKAVDSGESPATVVLKLDLHCEGCAKKVKRSVANLEGVVKVKTDCDAKKLTVTGNVDPTWLRDTVESKTKKKVELISPPPLNHNHNNTKPQQAVVVMKIRLHCEGCAHKIKRVILKNIDGVNSVTTDLQTNLVTVIGTMDTEQLTPYLIEKFKRSIEIVSTKNDENNEEKKEKDREEKKEKDNANDGGDNKEKENSAKEEKERNNSGEEKKEEEKGKGKENIEEEEKMKNNSGEEKIAKESISVGVGGGGEEEKGKKENDGHKGKTEGKLEADGGGGEGGKMEVNKMEHHSYNPHSYFVMPMYGQNYNNSQEEYDVAMYTHHYYHDEGEHSMQYRRGPPPAPPTYFSDENPNGCFLM